MKSSRYICCSVKEGAHGPFEAQIYRSSAQIRYWSKHFVISTFSSEWQRYPISPDKNMAVDAQQHRKEDGDFDLWKKKSITDK